MPKDKKKVMVVDDNPIEHKVYASFLSSDGYEMLSCYSAEECLKSVVEDMPDLILMDVILNDGDGKQIASQINDDVQTKHIPIIFTTNTVDLKDDRGNESFQINGKVYRAFAKPLHKRKILNVIRKEINRSINGGSLPQAVCENPAHRAEYPHNRTDKS